MKKQMMTITICTAMVFTLTASLPSNLFAENFAGREDEMNKKCAMIYDETTQKECAAYMDYLNGKSDDLEKNVEDIKKQIANVKGDITKVSDLITSNNEAITNAKESLVTIEASIKQITTSIETLKVQIEDKKVSIKERNALMKERVVEMQPYIGTNNYIDFLMGATNFTDLIRRTSVVSELNAYEQEQLAELQKEKKELEAKQEEVKTKQNLLKAQEVEVKTQKEKAEAYKAANEELLTTYREEESTLLEEKRKAQVESGQFASSIPNIDLSIIPSDWGDDTGDDGKDDKDDDNGNQGDDDNNQKPDNGGSDKPSGDKPSLSSGFIVPVQGNFYYSAGTWAYEGGDPHIGMDFGTYQSVGLSVVAPASGIVVAINNTEPNHGVYENGFGTWTGYPAGGGNTLHMIVNVNGVSYGVSFYHLSPNMFNVSVGDIVSQGQLIAHTGHSGNSSGPHCHVEITNLGKVSINKAVQIFYDYGKDYFYGNYTPAGRCTLKGSTPCLERPESFFGY